MAATQPRILSGSLFPLLKRKFNPAPERIDSFMNPNWKICFLIAVFVLTGRAASAQNPTELSSKDKMIVETVLRLKDFDLDSSQPAKAAVLRYLQSHPGTDQYFELIERFKPIGVATDLAQFSLEHAEETAGVRAATALFAMKQQDLLYAFVKGEDVAKAVSAVKLIGQTGGKQTLTMLSPLLENFKSKKSTGNSVAVQTAVVAALGRRLDGQKKLLGLVVQGKVPEELKFAFANVLLATSDASIAGEAAKHLSLPATVDNQPLPTLAELVKQNGDPKAGLKVFREAGTCNKCHLISGVGKAVGPDLSEIGDKLSREAMYISILDPSAAISHNFEAYSILTDEGEMITGVLVNRTDDVVTLRTSEGVDRSVKSETIDSFKKQTKSAMPQDLQKQMTVVQLVDLVEYLMTLKK